MANWLTPVHRELNRKLRDTLGAPTAGQFAKLGIDTVGDLVRHTPRRYISGTGMSDFASLRVGEEVAVVARVANTQVRAGGQLRVETTLTDGTGFLRATFFTTKKYLADHWQGLLTPGSRGIFVGKVGEFRSQPQLAHPDFVMIDTSGRITARKLDTARRHMERAVQRSTMVGLYPASAKLPTWTIAESISLLLPGVMELGDTLPDWVVEEAGVLPFPDALREVHEPVDREHARSGIERLRFDEAFALQLAMATRRAQREQELATPRERRPGGILDAFDARLPFELTAGQQQVGEQVFRELARPTPMHRLLQGDVGSGKTIVALRAMLCVVDAGGQAALLAPTEVLAQQHHATITRMLGDLGRAGQLDAAEEATSVALLTGGMPAGARRAVLDGVASGEVGLVVGTHALLSDPVAFTDLGLVVVDEQHRFGVEQRAALAAKAERQPHTLVMTATPIPRSVAMTVFGDLAVSELRERPAGRGSVTTVLVDTVTHPTWVERAWQRIREEAAAGRQAFVVAPAIQGRQVDGDLTSSDGATAVTELAPELRAGPLSGLRVGMLHGRLGSQERDSVMAAFVDGQLDVLVATTVIEVGVDVPNASVMVVMDADRFGISQLHQLRGRIGRGEHPGLCLLLSAAEPDSDAALRMQALVDSDDGFELAETDLQIRGEGDVLGAGQSGASSLKLLRAFTDRELIRTAKELAERVVRDPRAADDPLLADLRTQAELVAADEWLEKG